MKDSFPFSSICEFVTLYTLEIMPLSVMEHLPLQIFFLLLVLLLLLLEHLPRDTYVAVNTFSDGKRIPSVVYEATLRRAVIVGYILH